MKQRDSISICFICLAILKAARTEPIFKAEGLPSRSIHQLLADFVLARNLAELEGALLGASPGETIIVESTDVIVLTQPIKIRTPGITIRGRGKRRPLIKCAAPVESGSAFVLNVVDISIEFLKFESCLEDSAVRIEGSTVLNVSPSNRIAFRDVHFRSNGQKQNSKTSGGAIHSSCPPRTQCSKLRITIDHCSFNNNRGVKGGAVFIDHGDLEIRQSAFALNNATNSGGAVYFGSIAGNLSVLDSVFTANNAEWNRRFEINEAIVNAHGGGGAIFAVSSENINISQCQFTRNHGCISGGALDIRVGAFNKEDQRSTTFRLTNSLFMGNVAYCQASRRIGSYDIRPLLISSGGGMRFAGDGHEQIDCLIRNTTFIRNMARFGGALCLRGAVDPLRIQSSTFTDNMAEAAGGGLLVRGAVVEMKNSTLSGGQATGGAGAMFLDGGRLVTLPGDKKDEVSIFQNGIAAYGGGIQLMIGGNVDLRSTIFRNNTAFHYGGAIRFFSVTDRLILRGVIIENNRAIVGGGIAFYASPNFQITADGETMTQLINNTASVGGGMYFDTSHYVPITATMEDVQFKRNRAVALEHEEIKRITDLGSQFRAVEDSSVTNPYWFLEHFDLQQTTVDILATVPAGQGGGFCITLFNIQFASRTEIRLENIDIEDNEAVVGGGASVHFSELFWNEEFTTRPRCFPAVFGIDVCQRFYLQNVTIENNTADFAGGLFTTHPENILLTCDLARPRNTETFKAVFTKRIATEEDGKCFRIQNNRLRDVSERDGIDFGTSAKKIVMDGHDEWANLKEVASGEMLSLPSNESNALGGHELRVVVLDAFGQRIHRGIGDAQLGITLQSRNIVGEVRYDARNGIAIIDNTQAHGISVKGTLWIQSDRDSRVHMSMNFTTRRCYPGEFRSSDVCRLCQSQTYNLDPGHDCMPCEDHAVCFGSMIRVPMDGYWHSNPFSPQFHLCIYDDGCKYENRTQDLRAFYKNPLIVQEQLTVLDQLLNGNADPETLNQQMKTLNMTFGGLGRLPEFTSYNQCASGYTGMLCGSCVSGYGRGFTGNCERCPSKRRKASFFLGLSIFLTFVIISSNCLITLFSATARVQMVDIESKNAANSRPAALRRTEVHIREGPQIRARLSSNRTLSLHSTASSATSSRSLSQQLGAAVQLSETFKIFVNYLQITSAAGRLDINWRCDLDNFLSVQATFVGVTSEAVSIPCECNFSDDLAIPQSILAVWIKLLIPCMVSWTLTFLFIIHWVLTRPRRSKNSADPANCRIDRFATGILVIMIVTIYFSYIDNVRELLRSIDCVDVDEEVGPGETDRYQRYAGNVGLRVWIEDTSMRCFEGDHLITGIIGIIGLCFAFLIILFIIFWLPLNKTKQTDRNFVARYWFIYQAYRKVWYTAPWEAVIMIRKALIAAVIVFSFQLGASLQATLCAGILVLAQILQVSCRPFKVPEDHVYVPEYADGMFRFLHFPKFGEKWVKYNNDLSLNVIELMSLFSSFLVFYSAAISSDPNVSSGGVCLMTLVAYVCNAMFVLYVSYRLYSGAHVLLDLKLETLDPTFLAIRENSLGPANFVLKLYNVCRKSFHRYLDTRHQSSADETGYPDP